MAVFKQINRWVEQSDWIKDTLNNFLMNLVIKFSLTNLVEIKINDDLLEKGENP